MSYSQLAQMERYRILEMLLPLLLVVGTATATSQGSVATTCPIAKIEPQRLPDMNVPRFSHRLCYLNGELTVFGGHTSGFVLTRTAEYLKDGVWHEMPMVYNHDDPVFVPLRNGKVLLAGGYEKNLGIGQTYEVEMYDPSTHTFEGFGCLNKRRVHGMGIEVESGKVYISGNWYHPDGIELYEGKMQFAYVKETSEQRSLPFLFRTSDGDVLVVNSCHDNYGNSITSSVVDRVKGEPFHVPLLETWHPYLIHQGYACDVCFIGNEQKGDFAYLMPLRNAEGQVAIAEVRDTVFSLLPTDCLVPMKFGAADIIYNTPVVVDQSIQRGYVMGYDTIDCHRYILTIDYAHRPAQLKLYYTEPMTHTQSCTPILTPNGDLVITGGIGYRNTNFAPVAEVWLFPFGRPVESAEASSSVWWLWVLWFLLIAAFLIAFLYIYKRRRRLSSTPLPNVKSNELMDRITELMEKEQLYLDSDLNMSKVATRLGVHRNDVSMVVNTSKGISFSQLVNTYRIEHAKQQLLLNPDIKILNVAIGSGFSSDTSFFRTFKAIVGVTPKEWITQQTTDRL